MVVSYSYNGSVTLTNSNLTSNSTTGSGGAIQNSGPDGATTVNNSTFSNNSADRGGAINNGGPNGTVTVSESIFNNNSVSGSGGAIQAAGDTTTVINSTFTGNSATISSVGSGGAILAGFGTTNIIDSTFSNNSARAGGAIYNTGMDTNINSTINMNGSTLSNNSANVGGGIYNLFGTFNMKDSILSGNSASGDAGGFLNGGKLTINNSILSGNSASTDGGGIRNSDTATIVNSTLSGNSASTGGGIYNLGIATVTNSVLWGNSSQIVNTNSITVSYTGVEGGFVGAGNLNLSSGDDIFVAPEPASNAPTIVGDYHLTSTSMVINKGDNASVPTSITTDIDGEARIMLGTVDMGADEWGFALPPQNANLIYNSGFTKGANNDAGWRFYGSIQHAVLGGRMKLNFPTTVNGWMRQFRTQFPLQPGLRMVGWVVVSNQDAVAKDFQVMFRDSDLSNNYLCNFSIPANTWNKTYYMRFITQTDWEIIRVDIRPNVADANGLRFDNVNLRYRPWLTFTNNVECISPVFSDETPIPPTTELTTNNGGGVTAQHAAPLLADDGGLCNTLDWTDTNNWVGYLPTSEVQYVFDPFPIDGIYDANGDGVADTLYDAILYGFSSGKPLPTDAILIREAVIAMLNDRYDSNHPEAWWAIEIDTAEALAQGENAMLALAQQYVLSNTICL